MRELAWIAVAACTGDDLKPDAWSKVFDEQPGALLRVWGANAKDVYVVGADVGSGPAVLRYDGKKWRNLAPPTSGDLWWVVGVGPDDVRMVGDDGTVLRYTPSTDAFDVRQTPTTYRLFGVWGSSSSDVWYVGGNTGRNEGVILRDDGTSVREVMHASTASAAFFKVQGTSAGDVWMVGQRGVTLFYDGTDLVQRASGTTLPLMGVHGVTDRFFASGGVADGVLLAWDGSSWKNETPPSTPQMIGVWSIDGERAFAAGFNGHIYRREGGAWAELEGPIPTFQDLHAIWVDDAGGIWAVGGRLAEDPPKGGVLIHYGQPVSTEVEE